MDEWKKNTNSLKYFLVLIMFVAITDVSFLFNIPVIRQLTGFFFLSFLPGLLVLYIMKLDKLKLIEKVVFSVGLSVFLLMFIGLLMNSIYPLFGYHTPLSSESLLVSFSIVMVILSAIAYLRNRSSFLLSSDNLKLNVREKAYLLIPSLFPLLAIIGMRVMNNTSNNVVLIILLLMIPGYTIFLAVRHNKVPQTIYGPVILLYSVSLVLLLALRSNYILGYDIHDEYYIFKQTLQHGIWQPVVNNALDSCLSISILPTIYQSFLNINSEYLFKILYPLLFSISPLIVYLIARQYLNAPRSFLAAVFFMSQYIFLNAELDTRAVVAILFFGLSIAILFHNELKSFDRYLLFIIFSTSVIFSHYTTAYIFLFVLILTWLIVQLVQRFIWHSKSDPGRRLRMGKPQQTFHIPFGVIILYVVILYI